MSRRALVIVFVLALPVLLAATLPLRAVIAMGSDDTFESIGLSAVEASGPAWSGHLRAVRWHGVAHGDVAVSLRPLALLAGTRRVHLAARGLSIDLLQGRRSGFESASGQLDMSVRRPLAATVQLSLAGASLVFIDGRCHEAGGAVTAQLTGMPGSPLQLEGTVRCDGARGRLAFKTVEPATLPVETDLIIDARGGVELESRVRPPDEASSLALQAAGFRSTPDGLVRADSWRLAD